MSRHIDADANVLDGVAKQYDKDFKAFIDDLKAKEYKFTEEYFIQSMTLKEKNDFLQKIKVWINSGDYAKDKQFIKKLLNLGERGILHKRDYVEIELGRIVSKIRLDQKPHLLKRNYQTWLDSKNTVAKLTNPINFALEDGDFLMKRINANFQGHRLLTRWFMQDEALWKQIKVAINIALKEGFTFRKAKLAIKYVFSNGDDRAKSILITESTRINSEAKLKTFKKAGVRYYQYMAVMDSKTTDICIKMDLKIMKVDKMEIGVNAPPLHIGCRSSIQAYFIDDRTK